VFLYHLLFEISMNGQSPGKKMAAIRVITLEGGQPSISQFLLRWAFKSIDLPFWIIAGILWGGWPPWSVIFLFAGLICLALTRHSQRIGDLLAGTVLADLRNKSSWHDTVFLEVEEDYQPVFPQVMRLSDNDMNSIRQILDTSSGRKNEDYIARISDKVKQALHIETDITGIEFLTLLLKDYNHLSAK
jgi:hypothetical protein